MELSAPITIYWDLAPSAIVDEALLRICSEILECRPLMLQLYVPPAFHSETVRAVLGQFAGSPVSVALTIHGARSTIAGTAPDEWPGVKELLFACDSLAEVEHSVRIPGAGISFRVDRDNWRSLPRVARLSREQGNGRLVLPMQRLYGVESPFLLNTEEQGELEHDLAETGGASGLRLTIHDPFLWRAFNPGVPFPQGGCQAANTMIAVSPDGGVYPCPTLPVLLGNVGQVPLREIIASPAKKGLRKSIVQHPEGCGACGEIDVCRGGCRGRAYVIHGSLEGIDDACR